MCFRICRRYIGNWRHDNQILVILFTVIPFYFLVAFLFSHISSYSWLSFLPAYCLLSKNMACLDCNISSEKRLITQAMERIADKQSNKKECNSRTYEIKTMLLVTFCLCWELLQQILCCFILHSDRLSLWILYSLPLSAVGYTKDCIFIHYYRV